MTRRLPHLAAALVALLTLVLAALPAEAGKKRKKKKKPKEEQELSATQAAGAADTLLWAYDTAGAKEALEPLADDERPEIGIARARVLEQEMAYTEAAAAFKSYADMAPADPAPLVFLGETYLHADDMAAAQSAFAEGERRAKALLAKQPQDAQALYLLGVSQQRQKKYTSAIESFESARSADAGNALVVYQLGLTRAFQQDWKSAVDLLTEAIEMDSGIAYAYYYRGLSAAQLGRKDLLILDMDRFLIMAPNAPEAPRARRIRDSA